MIDLKLLQSSEPIELKLEKNLSVGGISDVKINCASIVKDGVADIPIANIVNTLGLVKYKNGYGIKVNEDGMLALESAQVTHIDRRFAGAYPIVAEKLDYAVKMAMTDGKGAEWSATEKASARARMGIEWRYIGKMETIEDVTSMSMALDSNGQPFNLRKVRIVAVNYPNASDLNGWIRFKYNNLQLHANCQVASGVKQSETKRVVDMQVEKIGEHLRVTHCYRSINSTNSSSSLGVPNGGGAVYDYEHTQFNEFINKIEMYSYQACIGKGAYMEVWGVDA